MSWLLILLIWAWATPASAEVEARCAELGAACVCNETLNVADTLTGTLHNFSNSGPGEQCNDPPSNFSAGDFINADLTKFSMATSASSGIDLNLPAPNRVLQGTVSTGVAQIRDSDRTFTDSTFCHRIYVKYSEGWPDNSSSSWFGGDCDIKAGRFSQDTDGGCPDAVPAQQCDWKPDGLRCANDNCGPFNCTPGETCLGGQWHDLATGDEVTFAECQTSWCRIERCFDHNSRSGGDADKLVWRMRVTRVSDGQEMNYPASLQQGSNGSATTGPISRVYTTTTPGNDWSKPGGDCPPDNSGPPDGETISMSHSLSAVVTPADESFWIGAASEIEAEAAGTHIMSGGSTAGGSF